ncbi:T9SS type B sorting domain-containing protein [Flavobacterium soyangense]|uniref:T9SS type B sorting domain-containing protein n=1 Tax=Flavobacterium soyangense TaxID=2023265 RepID=A0A930XUT3_9FLAO|nr:T9SS type B sorting domain-containing protein [Flavobacterium soyangense]MBF2708915.1 T9SS type B sorting domain-containing protein [Flavobacterium soyangense]
MKWEQTIIFFAFICCNTLIVSAQNITVDDTKTVQQLVEKLVNSACANFTNFSVSGDIYTSGYNSYGEFTKNGSSFPLEDGIVLSTWSSKNSIGPFVRNQGQGSTSWLGDADLNKALNITTTINATSLEFDFIPLTSFLSFNYIFASNEYQDDFPCRFSDGFAFLIKEKGGSANYQNLAVIPASTTPVSSTSIHQAISFTDSFGNLKSCPAKNENYFGSSNTSPTNTSPINYAGQTIVMNAQTNVVVGKTYHIKLVISDDVTKDYDSAVFLQAGSFSPKIDLGPDRLITNNPICFGDRYTIDTQLSPAYIYKWFKDSSLTPISGETFPSYNAVDSGTYKVEVDLGAGCIATGTIKIEFAPEIKLNDATLIKCVTKLSDTAFFDLTKAEATIKNNNPSLAKIDYFETQTGTILSKPILNPVSFPKTTSNDVTVFAKLTSKTYGCIETAKITLKTMVSTPSALPLTPPVVNDFSGDGNSVQLIPPDTGGSYEFSLDGTNYQVSPLFTNLAIGNYTAYIRDLNNCEYLTYLVDILDYPQFFTPNGDGYNDIWKIKIFDLFPKATITIFDRYGKLLKQLDSKNSGWDGTYIGNEMPATDYWFNLNSGDGKIIRGHFSLKR